MDARRRTRARAVVVPIGLCLLGLFCGFLLRERHVRSSLDRGPEEIARGDRPTTSGGEAGPDSAARLEIYESPVPAAITGASIRGTVYLDAMEGASRKPAAGAQVVAICPHAGVLRAAALTGSSGRYELCDLTPGRYHVVAWRDSWTTGWVPQADREVQVSEGETRHYIDRVLVPGGNLAGRVVGAVDGKPIAGALVAEHRGRFTQTDAHGAFVLEGVRGGTVRLALSAAGFATRRLDTEVHSGPAVREGPSSRDRTTSRGTYGRAENATELVVALLPGGSVFGTVRDAADHPAPSAEVTLKASGLELRATAGIDGRFRIEGVPLEARNLIVRASLQGLHAVEDVVPHLPADGRSVRVDLQLVEGRRLAGRVLDSNGVPVARARLFTSNTGNAPVALTDDRGAFEIAGLPTRPGTLTARSRGHAPASIDLGALDVDNLESIDLVLHPGEAVAGKVLSDTGKPVPGAWVYVATRENHAGPYPQTAAATDGGFVFEDLPGDLREIGALANGFVPRRGIPVRAGDETVEIVLGASGLLEGLVLDRGTRDPVVGFNVLVELVGQDKATTATVGPATVSIPVALAERGRRFAGKDGRFRIVEGLFPEIAYRLRVRAEGYEPFEVPRVVAWALEGVDSESEHGRTIEILLERGAPLRGTVLDASDGSPVAGTRISFFSRDRLDVGGRLQRRSHAGQLDGTPISASDDDGRFALLGVSAVPGSLVLERVGYARTVYHDVAPAAIEQAFELPHEAIAYVNVREADGEPAHGCSVRLSVSGETFRAPPTDAEGATVLAGLPAGRATVTVSGGNGVAHEEHVELVAGDASVLDIVLRPGSLGGRVSQRGAGIPGATVYVRARGAPTTLSPETTDNGGRFAIRGLPPGIWEVKAVRPGEDIVLSTGVTATVTVGNGESWCELAFSGGRIDGALLDPRGQPLGAATIELLRRHDETPTSGIVSRTGSPWRSEARAPLGPNDPSFRFDGLLAGEYALTATRAGEATVIAWSEPVRLGDGELRRMDLVAREAGALSVLVEWRDGRPAANAACILRPADGAPPGRVARCDADGIGRFERVPDGRYRVEISAEEALAVSMEIDVRDEAHAFSATLEEASWLIVGLEPRGDRQSPPGIAPDSLRLAAVVLEGDDPGWRSLEAGSERPMYAVGYGRSQHAPEAFVFKTRAGRYRLRLDLARAAAAFEERPLVSREEEVVVPAGGDTVRLSLPLPSLGR